jgi:hypothetical protein
VTDSVAIVEAVVVRDIRIGVTPGAVLVSLLNDATEVTFDDADGARWVLHYLDLHFLTFRYP